MTTTDLMTSWVALSPFQRTAVREVYFHARSIPQTAVRCRSNVGEVARALQVAYRTVATHVLRPDRDDDAVTTEVAVRTALHDVGALRVAAWRWDTAAEAMTWSNDLFGLYGYPVGAVDPTIGLHQAHKHTEDRAAVERLVITSATSRGPVVFPQRIVRTDGQICRVVMHVTRAPEPGEVLTGRVVAEASG